MQHDLAPVRRVAVLEEIDALPGAERQPAGGHRNGERGRRQRRLDVRRHVVGAFAAVDEIAHRRIVGRRHQPPEEGVEVAPHVRIGIFLDQQRAGCVPHEHRQQPDLDARAADEGLGLVREFVKPLPRWSK